MEVKSESEVAQSCPTLHDPMDCSPPGSSIHGIFQARVLEWGAIAFSKSTSVMLNIEEKGKNICQASGNESLSETKSLNLLNHKKLTSVVFSSKLHFHSLSPLDRSQALEICMWVCMCAESCPVVCSSIDCNLPDSSVHGFSRQEYWSELDSPDKMVYFGVAFETHFFFFFLFFTGKLSKENSSSLYQGFS